MTPARHLTNSVGKEPHPSPIPSSTSGIADSPLTLATRELLTRFEVSRYVNDFDFAVVTCGLDATAHTHPTPAASIDDNASCDPMPGHGGGTDIAKGPEKASELVDAFLAQAPPEGGVPYSAVIVVMSGGECGKAGDTRQAAQRIRSGANGARVTICSTLIATVAKTDAEAEPLLKGPRIRSRTTRPSTTPTRRAASSSRR